MEGRAGMTRGAFFTGLATGLVLGAALAFGVFYVPHRAPGGDALRFDVILEDAAGLRVGSPVQVRGIDAGRVRALHLVEVPRLGSRVAARVHLDDAERFGASLTERAEIRLARHALLGEVIVAITPQAGGAPLESGVALMATAPASTEALIAQAAAIAQRLHDFLDGDQPGDPSLRRSLLHLEETLRRLRDFADRLPR